MARSRAATVHGSGTAIDEIGEMAHLAASMTGSCHTTTTPSAVKCRSISRVVTARSTRRLECRQRVLRFQAPRSPMALQVERGRRNGSTGNNRAGWCGSQHGRGVRRRLAARPATSTTRDERPGTTTGRPRRAIGRLLAARWAPGGLDVDRRIHDRGRRLTGRFVFPRRCASRTHCTRGSESGRFKTSTTGAPSAHRLIENWSLSETTTMRSLCAACSAFSQLLPCWRPCSSLPLVRPRPTTCRHPQSTTSTRWSFPSAEDNHYTNTFGAPRSGDRTHEGTDILADKMVPVVAAAVEPSAGCRAPVVHSRSNTKTDGLPSTTT